MLLELFYLYKRIVIDRRFYSTPFLLSLLLLVFIVRLIFLRDLRNLFVRLILFNLSWYFSHEQLLFSLARAKRYIPLNLIWILHIILKLISALFKPKITPKKIEIALSFWFLIVFFFPCNEEEKTKKQGQSKYQDYYLFLFFLFWTIY